MNNRLVYTTLILAGLMVLQSVRAEVSFERDVARILVKRCVECHDSKQKKGGLDLTNVTAMTAGGDSGEVVKKGNASISHLIQRITDGDMPPASKGIPQPLPAAETKILTAWVNEGMIWPKDRVLDLYEQTTEVRGGRDWWSFQPILSPQLPIPLSDPRVGNEIDSFIISKLSSSGMSPSKPTTRGKLIRRLFFDLTGLPPRPKDIEEFLATNQKVNYESLVDKLLASPQFGERWARHWLDLIRFAETCGYERDQLKPNIWKYRDWVVNAFNSDMPYDKFVTDQLAGDEVPYRDDETVVATGMIRAGTWNDEPNDPADYQYTRLEDMVHTTSSAFIGLTVKCARCHDHKFDPIRQTDYYRFANAFWSGFIGQANLGGPSEAELGSKAFGWTDRSSEVVPLHLLVNGERQKPGEVIAPGSISTVPILEQSFKLPPEGSRTTTQRLQLASWLTHPDHPLTARVIVNRLWLHTMGEGLVRTPNNFGFKGDPPTHPKLLDFLASRLIDNGWKLKPIIKLIVMSNTYRQASTHESYLEYQDKDFLNLTWWRAQRKRLDAEQLRDAILVTSGEINLKSGGPSFYPAMSVEALEGLSKKSSAWGNSSLAERNRRSIYMMTKRSRLLPLMTTFNFTDTTLPCGQRDVTTVATQALALLNNHFVHQQSSAFADRLRKEYPDDVVAQIRAAWNHATGRNPTADELAASREHVSDQVEHYGIMTEISAEKLTKLSVKADLSLWLDATQRIEVDEDSRIISWGDASGSSLDGQQPIDAVQGERTIRPLYVADGLNGKPTLRFNGKNQYLKLTSAPLSDQSFTMVTVATDTSVNEGHRELISNWNSRGRSVNSLFLGSTRGGVIRLSDNFANGGTLLNRGQPFILGAINAADSAVTFQNGGKLAQAPPLTERVLAGPWVIGTQGNINGEYWLGDISEILIYDRALSEPELRQIWGYLSHKYNIPLRADRSSPDRLALTSLCHVLLNTNEFIYID